MNVQNPTPLQALRSRADRKAPDGLVTSRETYSFRQARRFRRDRPLTDQQVEARLNDGKDVVVSEIRDILDSQGRTIDSEVAETTLSSMSALEAFARINTGTPAGEFEELASKADVLHNQPLNGGKVGTIRASVYDAASWETTGRNYRKDLGARSDAWIARNVTDDFVDFHGGEPELHARTKSYDHTSGVWDKGRSRGLGKKELRGDIASEYS